MRSQEALAGAAARCIALGLDESTTESTVAELRTQHRAALQHRAMVAEMRTQTSQATERITTAQELAQIARDRLVHADRALQAKVFALLDVRVQIVSHQPLQLEVEGSVAHDLLLRQVQEPVAPDVLASGACEACPAWSSSVAGHRGSSLAVKVRSKESGARSPFLAVRPPTCTFFGSGGRI